MGKFVTCFAMFLWLFALPGTTRAQSGPQTDTPILFSADQLTHNRELGIVTARGRVEASQGDRVLLADTISYNERQNVLTASGNVSLMEPTGDVIFAEYFELTGDFKDGIIRDIRVLLSDNARIAAAGGRRSDGNILELRNAVYSPCETCGGDAGSEPLWQLKANKIVHDRKEQVIEYTDAYLEFAGIPVAYTPFFSHPDPTVKRRSGFLTPGVGGSQRFGSTLRTPYYFAISPSQDLTVAPTLTTKERGILDAEYRRRFGNGELEAIASITYNSDNEVRGHIDSKGRFDIDDVWRWGYQAQRSTDDTYTRLYSYGAGESTLTSRLFTEGFRQRNYMAINAYAFQGLAETDDPGTTPLVLPMAEYKRIEEPGRFGGRTFLDLGFVALTRTAGTDSRRLSVNTGWRAPFIGRFGNVTSLSASLRGDMYHVNSLVRRGKPGTFDGITGRIVPEIRGDWRFPLSRQQGRVNQIIEPLASVVLSPYGGNPDSIPNDDSIDVEFDDTNLLSSNRFSGNDRVEGGPRINYGLRWGMFGSGGGSSSVFIGQSYRYKVDDTFNEGSGLNDNFSDIVGRLTVSPSSLLDLTYRARLDAEDLSPERTEITLMAGAPALRVNADYVLFERQTGSEFRGREELSGGINTKLNRFWRSSASGRFDLEDGGNLRQINFGLIYECECFTFAVTLSRSFFEDRDLKPNDSLFFRLTFKTLGDVQTGISRSGG